MELHELLGRASAIAGGTGSVVEIVGAPGIGKSRLVSEAIDRWSLDTLRVACEQYGSATPYLAFRHVFRRLLGGASDAANDIVVAELRRVVHAFLPDLEPFLPLLADIVDVPLPSTREVNELEPRFRRTRLEQSAVKLMGLFISGPSALVLEDAHAIDEASASLLRRVVGETDSLPLLVVLTRGPETPLDLPESSDRLVIELEPLGVDVAARLAGGGSGPVLAPTQVAAIVERANGSPMFLRELLRAAGEAGSVEGLPDSLEPLLAAQIDLLSPSDRQVLRAAAVLGGHFDPDILHELLEDAITVDEHCMGPAPRLRRPDCRRPTLHARPHPRRSLRRAVVQAAQRTARPGGECHRDEDGHPRRGRRAAVASLDERGTLRTGMALLTYCR